MKPLIGIVISLLLITNVSVVLGNSEEKGNTVENIIWSPSRMHPNLAPNPSFEEGDSMPTGWTSAPGSNGTYTWDSNYAHSGEKSVGVSNLTSNSDSPEVMWITTDFISVDCTIYRYMFLTWFKFVEIPPECHFAQVSILDYDINHQFIGENGGGLGGIDDTEWHNFGIITNYGNTTKYVKLEIGQRYGLMGEPNPLIEIRFDDINFSIWKTVPDTPKITGETHGRIRTLYEYTITTTDQDLDDVRYEIDWGDNMTQFTDFYESGDGVIVNHTWASKGTYQIKVRAIDGYQGKSDWATLEVTMPFSSTTLFIRYWMNIFERFPNAFHILRFLLGFN